MARSEKYGTLQINPEFADGSSWVPGITVVQSPDQRCIG